MKHSRPPIAERKEIGGFSCIEKHRRMSAVSVEKIEDSGKQVGDRHGAAGPSTSARITCLRDDLQRRAALHKRGPEQGQRDDQRTGNPDETAVKRPAASLPQKYSEQSEPQIEKWNLEWRIAAKMKLTALHQSTIPAAAFFHSGNGSKQFLPATSISAHEASISGSIGGQEKNHCM